MFKTIHKNNQNSTAANRLNNRILLFLEIGEQVLSKTKEMIIV